MKELRLAWEPQNLTSLEVINGRFMQYMRGKNGLTILANGTLLFITEGSDNEADAKKAMTEAKFLTDFKVFELNEGGYLVSFHPAVAVFVGREEFLSIKPEVEKRIKELQFPSEHFFASADDNFLIGLYARGKLQHDVYNFAFYKRIPPLEKRQA